MPADNRRARGPKKEPAIRRAAENLLAKYRVADWVHYQIELQPRAQFIQTTRGRPSPWTTYKQVVRTIPVVSATQDAAAIARAQTTDGTFPLVTNTDLPPEVANRTPKNGCENLQPATAECK